MLTNPLFQPRHAVRAGLLPDHRTDAAMLYWHAFGRDILPFPLPPQQGAALIAHTLRPEMALTATDATGRLAAMAGIRDARGGLLAGDARNFIAACGPVLGRLAYLASTLHRSGPATSDMVLDGLIVRPDLRGQGYGQALVAMAADLAYQRGYSGLRAELSASNDAARALYHGLGFRPCGTARIGWPWSGQAQIMRFQHPAADSFRSSPSPAPAA